MGCKPAASYQRASSQAKRGGRLKIGLQDAILPHVIIAAESGTSGRRRDRGAIPATGRRSTFARDASDWPVQPQKFELLQRIRAREVETVSIVVNGNLEAAIGFLDRNRHARRPCMLLHIG